MRNERPQVGDVVQVGGQGRGMVVLSPEQLTDRWWEGEPEAVVCGWTEGGVARDGIYRASDLEVVGSQRRRSDREVYDKMTAIAVETITAMAVEKRHLAARAAFQMWLALAGPMASDNDALRLQQLVDRSE